jgi:hypothetical protein
MGPSPITHVYLEKATGLGQGTPCQPLHKILFCFATDREHVASAEENRAETQQAILQDTLQALKDEKRRINEDAWMFERPRCTWR